MGAPAPPLIRTASDTFLCGHATCDLFMTATLTGPCTKGMGMGMLSKIAARKRAVLSACLWTGSRAGKSHLSPESEFDS